MTEEQMQAIQTSLNLLLQQNKEMSEKICKLEHKNKELESSTSLARERLESNKAKWVEGNKEAEELFTKLAEIQAELKKDNIDDQFLQDNSVQISKFADLSVLWGNVKDQVGAATIKKELDELETPGTPFDLVGKEERCDEVFGRDGDYTAVTMRRFIERYKVVKDLNMRARLRGWDSPSYRAGKLRLCLMGEAFDFVSFASSICEDWAEDDEKIIEKLREKFTNIQAIELNILAFERSAQEAKESIGDFMTRLRRSVKDAYDGDLQRELDRKVAWKFVSGVNDDRVRRKLLEDGWMKSRQEAKPLEDLLKTAEIAKKTDDAVKALDKAGTVGVAQILDNEHGTVSAWEKAGARSKMSSTESSNSSKSSSSSKQSSGSSSSSGISLGFKECFYCKQKHRGGWFNCSKRKRENPKWRPQWKGEKASLNKKDGGQGDFRS